MAKETTQTREKTLEPFTVMLNTHYLTMPAQVFEKELTQNDLEKEKEMYGYNPNNLAEVSSLKTNMGREVVLSNGKRNTYGRLNFETLLHIDSVENYWAGCGVLRDLVISGESHEDIRTLEGRSWLDWLNSRLVIARYSGFYGTNSTDSGSTIKPEEIGFSLDIPKEIEVVKRLIVYEPFIEAIQKRNYGGLMNALASFNMGIKRPVLTTPYLKTVFEKDYPYSKS